MKPSLFARKPYWLPMPLMLIAASAWMPLLGGCVKMDVMPASDDELQMALAEPRGFDVQVLDTERDPTKIYRVGPGDIIRIDSRKDPSLSEQLYTVTAEGYILIPYFSPVRVGDLTSDEIAQVVNEMLSEFIREPDVNVGIQEYNSKVVYVRGQVTNPGAHPMKADMLTLMQAIEAAGLPSSEAAMQRTFVIRPHESNPVVKEVNLTDILYRGIMAENVLLQPDDIVYVPSRYTTNFTSAIRDLLRPVQEVNRARSSVFISTPDSNNDNNN